MNRCWSLEHFGHQGLQQTVTGSFERALKPGEVRVRIRAASLNYRDHLMIGGLYNPKQALPLIPGSDGAGEIVEVGPEVSRVVLNDRVALTFFKDWIDGPMPDLASIRKTRGGPLPGTLLEEIIVHEDECVIIPSYFSFEEAACFPCAGLTAWTALRELGGSMRTGETVLIQGTGGVSSFAIQLANAMGLRTIVITGSKHKEEYIKNLGDSSDPRRRGIEIIFRNEYPEWHKEVKKISPEGVDRVLDVGGAETVNESLKVLRPGGVLQLIGVLSGTKVMMDLTNIMMRGFQVNGILVGHRRSLESLFHFAEQNQMKPAIDSVFEFDKLPAALEYLVSGKQMGKIVIRHNSKVYLC